MSQVRNKLLGYVSMEYAPAGGDLRSLSPSDQVDCVVAAAMDPKNLSRMYHGWAPYC